MGRRVFLLFLVLLLLPFQKSSRQLGGRKDIPMTPGSVMLPHAAGYIQLGCRE